MIRSSLPGLLSLLLGAASCRRSSAHEGPYGDKVATYVPMIEKALGRTFKTKPTLQVRTKDQVRQFLIQHLADSVPRRELATPTTAPTRQAAAGQLRWRRVSARRIQRQLRKEPASGYSQFWRIAGCRRS